MPLLNQLDRVEDLPRRLPLPPATRWQRLIKHRYCSHHNRLLLLVLAVNVGVAAAVSVDEKVATDAVLANLVVAVLIRQRMVVNSLFTVATSLPLWAPLRLRQLAAKVYHLGGIHVGSALAAVGWYLVLVVELIAHRPWRSGGLVLANVVLALAVLSLLVAVAACAAPVVRARHHDLFERSHRFGGWCLLVLLWAQTVIAAALPGGWRAFGAELLTLNQFWALLTVTVCVVEPWVRLRRQEVTVTTPSNHVAILEFDGRSSLVHGSGSAISLDPLREWHSFTAVSTSNRQNPRLFISRAGDWTSRFIDDPPRSVWVKGGPTHTFKDVERLFGSMLFVATGSGIGPAMTAFRFRDRPSALVWVARAPRQTYGDDVVEEILATVPAAIIVDTNRDGKPDMLELSYAVARHVEAEAVLCVANPVVTWALVSGLESRGIPAVGPIWDS